MCLRRRFRKNEGKKRLPYPFTPPFWSVTSLHEEPLDFQQKEFLLLLLLLQSCEIEV